MRDKKQVRQRRARKLRAKVSRLGKKRLCVHRTSQHIYAQLFDETGATVLASASTLEPSVRADLKQTSNCEAATVVGKRIAGLAKDSGVDEVAFDRSGFRYHGRIKALAEAAREAGLKF